MWSSLINGRWAREKVTYCALDSDRFFEYQQSWDETALSSSFSSSSSLLYKWRMEAQRVFFLAAVTAVTARKCQSQDPHPCRSDFQGLCSVQEFLLPPITRRTEPLLSPGPLSIVLLFQSKLSGQKVCWMWHVIQRLSCIMCKKKKKRHF